MHSIKQRYHELGIREHKFLAGLSNFNWPGTIKCIQINEKQIESKMRVSKKYTRNNSFNGAYMPTLRRMRNRQFYGFTVTLRDNSWTVIINNIFQKKDI